MRPYLHRLFFIAFVLLGNIALGQSSFTLSGKVTDEKGQPMHLATVFISGTKRITGTNPAGEFTFTNLEPGTYQLSVQSIGYAPFAKNVLIQVRDVTLNVSMKVKPIMLSEVQIGKGDRFEEFFRIFRQEFLGFSENAKACVVLNPKVINFGTQKNLLKADADEFMIIENKRLGYRIRYLLKTFEHNTSIKRTNYDGETSFEEMDGTPEQKEIWAKNRMEAYTGSLMHFLRAIYYNTVQQEGFLAQQLYLNQFRYGKALAADPRPIRFDTVVNVIDTSFISMKFTSWMVEHAPKKLAKLDTLQKDTTAQRMELADRATVVNLYLPEAIIDKRGSFPDYRTFLLQGFWGRKRIGDQLPFEYQPPVAAGQ